MFSKNDNRFLSVIMHGFIGALAGIIGGAILGMVIWAIVTVSATDAMNYGPPREAVLFMAMGFGALFGAFSGLQVAFKEKK